MGGPTSPVLPATHICKVRANLGKVLPLWRVKLFKRQVNGDCLHGFPFLSVDSIRDGGGAFGRIPQVSTWSGGPVNAHGLAVGISADLAID